MSDEIFRLKAELDRAYRCIVGFHNAHLDGLRFERVGYHELTIGAARRWTYESKLDGSGYFIGKPPEVLHEALMLGRKTS